MISRKARCGSIEDRNAVLRREPRRIENAINCLIHIYLRRESLSFVETFGARNIGRDPKFEAASFPQIYESERLGKTKANRRAPGEFCGEQLPMGQPFEPIPNHCFGKRGLQTARCIEDSKTLVGSAEARIGGSAAQRCLDIFRVDDPNIIRKLEQPGLARKQRRIDRHGSTKISGCEIEHTL